MDEVVVLVNLPSGTRAKQLHVRITPRELRAGMRDEAPMVQGELAAGVVVDDSSWTVVDQSELHITLIKSARAAGDAWPSLFVTTPRFEVPAETMDRVEQKLTLERFSREHPGLDFSSAAITGNYKGGGPKMPEP